MGQHAANLRDVWDEKKGFTLIHVDGSTERREMHREKLPRERSELREIRRVTRYRTGLIVVFLKRREKGLISRREGENMIAK